VTTRSDLPVPPIRPRIAFIPVIAALLYVLALPATLEAASISWIAGDGNWNDPNKWVGGVVPGPADDVFINANYTVPYIVTFNTTATVNSITLGAGNAGGIEQTLRIEGGTLTIATASNVTPRGQLELSVGILTGAGDLTVDGAFVWSGGTISGSGSLVLNPSVNAIISGTADKFMSDRTLVNSGSVIWTGTGRLFTSSGAVIDNTSSGLFDIQTNAAFGYCCAGGAVGTFNNSGTLQKSAATGTSLIDQVINNSGTVSVLSGILSLARGGGSSSNFAVSSGAELHFSAADYTLNAGSSFTGPGISALTGGSLIVAADSTAENFRIQGGTLTGSSTLTINSIFSWTGGTMSGNGATTISPAAAASISGTTDKFLSVRTLSNSGTVTWTGTGRLFTNTGAAINNAASGLFDIQTDANFGYCCAGGAVGTFNNSGTLQKSVATGTSLVDQVINNSGTVSVLSGILSLARGGASSSSFAVFPGAELHFSAADYTFNAGSSFTGPGTSALTGGSLIVAADSTAENFRIQGGTLTGPSILTITGSFEWTGGTMAGSGATSIPFAASATISGTTDKFLSARTLSNSGTVTWTGTGRLFTNTGAAINNAASGLFDIQTDANLGYCCAGGAVGTFNNSGTLQKSVTTGTTQVEQIVNNDGTLSVLSGIVALSRGGASSSTFAVSSGAELHFSAGDYTLNSGSSFSGAGTPALTGGSLVVAADSTAENFRIQGGTLTGPSILTITSSLSWTGGTMAGSGATSIPFAAFAAISGTTDKFLSARSLLNSGTVTWTGTGRLFTNTGAVIDNEPGGLFDIRTDASFGFCCAGGAGGTFNNGGTLRKSVATGSSSVEQIINNDGTLSVLSGILSLTRGGTGSSTFDVAAGAELHFSASDFTLNSGSTFTGAGTPALTGGSLVVAADATAENFRIQGGTLAGPSILTITGSFEWTGGTMSGSGTTMLSSTANGTISGTTDRFLSTRTLTNSGTIAWSGTGRFWTNQGAVFDNTSTGAFDIQTDAAFGYCCAGGTRGTFRNQGTLRKSLASGTTAVDQILENDGMVLGEFGTISFTAGGTSSGSFIASAPGTIEFGGGTHLLDADSTVTGDGTIRFSTGTTTVTGNYDVTGTTMIISGTASFETPALTSHLLLSGGILAGNSSFTVDTSFGWSGGTMQGSGSTILPSTLSGTISGGSDKFLTSRTLENRGTLIWTDAGRLWTSLGATIHNKAGATFDIRTDAVFGFCCAGGAKGSFINEGTLRKSVAIGSSQFDQLLDNSGVVDASAGILSLTAGFVQTAGSTQLTGGAIASSTTIDLQGGILSGAGMITGNLTNAAQIHPGLSPGMLEITGNYTQTSAGTLAIELGGTTAGSEHDQLIVGGAATLDGTLAISLIGGYDPLHGDSFEILTFGSRSGDFASTTGLNLPDGDVLQPSYGASALTLVNQAAMPGAHFPRNDDGSVEMTFQSCQGYAAGAVCPPPFAQTGGATLFAQIGDDGGNCLRFTVMSFDTSNWTAGDLYELFVTESSRTGSPFASLGGEMIIEATTSTSMTPSRAEASSSSFVEIGRFDEAALYALSGVDLSAAINQILTAPHDPFLHLRFRFPVCTNGSSSIDAAFLEVGPGNPARLRIQQTAATADLAITKSASVSSAPPATPFAYTLSVANSGPDSASVITVTDTLPAGVSFVSVAGAGWSCSEMSGTITCTRASLAAGANATITVDALTPVTPGTYVNTAMVSSATTDPDTANNTASASITVLSVTADLAITKSSSSSTIASGSTFNFQLQVTNLGPDPAGGIVVSDPLPGRFSLVSIAAGGWSCSHSGGLVECTLPSLPAGSADPIILTVKDIGTTAGSETNTASVSASSPDPNSGNNLSSAVVQIVDEADLRILKSGPAEVTQSEWITYELYVENLGPGTAFLITVEDALPADVSFVSVSGANSECSQAHGMVICQISSLAAGAFETISLTISPQITSGTITNVASVRWDGIDPVAGNNSSSATTTIAACPTPVELLNPPHEGRNVDVDGLLSWEANPDAEIYSVYLGPAGSGCGVLLGTTSGTSFAYHVLSHDTGYVWRVVAGRIGCPAVSSACFRFQTAAEPPPPDPCENLGSTVVAVAGETKSGEPYQASWEPVEGADLYELQESATEAFDGPAIFLTAGTTVELQHETVEPVAYFYRVRALCDEIAGPWSPASRIVIVPPSTSTLETTLVRDFGYSDPVETMIQIPFPEELAPPGTPIGFEASADQPWLTVLPASGLTPAEGLQLMLIVDPAQLPVGSSQGTISIVFQILTGAKRVESASTSSTTSHGVTMTLVTPVTPTPKGPPPADALIIPAVAHVPGIASQWQSDIRIANVSPTNARYQISFTATGVDGTQSGKQSEIQIGPGTTVAINDIVKRWYGLGSLGDGTSGVLDIRRIGAQVPPPGGGQVSMSTIASSRTYNLTPAGTIGQFVPAVPFHRFLGRNVADGPSGSLTMLHVAQSARFRTNVGLVEGAGAAATVRISIRSTTGTLLDDFDIQLRPAEHRQLNSILAQRGLSLSTGRIDVRVVEGAGRITSYASIIDNASSDPMLVPGTPLESSLSNRWIIAGVADLTTGQNRWRSDLQILNPGEDTATLELTFRPQGTPEETTTREITIGPGEIAVLNDVLRERFGITDRGGAIHLRSDAQRSLVVSGRTYDDRDVEGSFGQFLQGLTPADSFGAGDRPLQILQVEDSPRFRANLGIAEVTGQAATIEVSVIAPGALTAPIIRLDLQPFEFIQLNSIGKRFGINNLYNGRITVRVISGQGRIIAYGSVIDESTQDPSYVPSQ
jgi:uncharacterized repeat protein (TIGR01451 family)